VAQQRIDEVDRQARRNAWRRRDGGWAWSRRESPPPCPRSPSRR